MDYMHDADLRLQDFLTSDDSQVAFEFARCMVGKAERICMGFCFETTEFDNGSVFLQGIWYRLRGPKPLLKCIGNMNTQSGQNGSFDWDSLTASNGLYKSDKLIVFEECGGVWAPTINTDTIQLDWDEYYG